MPKAPSRINTTASTSPWWLTEGDLECPHCGHLYFIEVEFRCPECDGPGCPHCRIKHVEGHLVCTGCAAEAQSNG
jgi:hypothetical protein